MPTSLTIDGLMQAARECSRGVKWKASVASWVAPCHLAANCLKLWRELDGGSYRLSDYVTFEITSPKRRVIRSPRFRDRVVQRAMCNRGLYRDLTRSNILDNAACQIGKGTLFAQERLAGMLREHWRHHGNAGWCLRLDVRHFFDSLPHGGLKAMVARQVRNPEFAARVEEVIDSFPDPGIGLGSQISQLLAIAYLSPLDHFVKERLRVRHYIRYSDDMVLLSPDREELRRAWREIAAWLSAHGLSLNPKSALHPIAQGVRFLKFRFVLTATGRVLKLLSRGSARRMLRRMKRLKALGRDFSAIEHCYQSWRAHALQGNTNHQQRILRQWITHNSPQRTRAADAWPSA